MSHLLESALTAAQRAECEANDHCAADNTPIAAHAATEVGQFTMTGEPHVDRLTTLAQAMLAATRAQWMMRCVCAVLATATVAFVGGVYVGNASAVGLEATAFEGATSGPQALPPTLGEIEEKMHEHWDRLGVQPRRSVNGAVVRKTT